MLTNLYKKFYKFIKGTFRNKYALPSKKLNKILSGNLLGKKYHVSNGATLTIKNNTNNEKTIYEKNIEDVAKKYLKEPDELFKYIESKGTKVHKIKNADIILKYIRESEGFIYPKKGLKALYLNLILNKKISFNTNEQFVLRNYQTIECVLLYHFYNWYCFKNNTDGFDTITQEKFKDVFKICSSKEQMENLSFEDLLLLKTAVRRDIEAIEFVEKYMKNNIGAKKKLENLKSGKLVKI